MAVTTPPYLTHVHQEEIIQNDNEYQSFAEDTYNKVIQNNNWLVDLRPVGTVMLIEINMEGGGSPDPAVWQECNGGEIVSPDSPLRSIGIFLNFVPDMRDRYVRSVSNLGSNPMAGSQEHNLNHLHTTGGASSVGPGIEDKGDRNYREPHNHDIADEFTNPTLFDSPAYTYVIAYMKIV